jgi:hypothetical protein
VAYFSFNKKSEQKRTEKIFYATYIFAIHSRHLECASASFFDPEHLSAFCMQAQVSKLCTGRSANKNKFLIAANFDLVIYNR